MNDDTRINSLELVGAAGLSDTKVLSRWHKAGLLPRPRIEGHPGGRGTVATWPAWAVERCGKLAALEASGFRIPDMLAELKAEAARQYRGMDANFAEMLAADQAGAWEETRGIEDEADRESAFARAFFKRYQDTFKVRAEQIEQIDEAYGDLIGLGK